MHIALSAPQEFIGNIKAGFTKNVPTAGTRVQATATETACTGVVVTASETNPGIIVLGGSDVVADNTGTNRVGFCVLQPGQTAIIAIREVSILYLDATANNCKALISPING